MKTVQKTCKQAVDSKKETICNLENQKNNQIIVLGKVSTSTMGGPQGNFMEIRGRSRR
ncbi:MAG: hypothetical protein ABH827_04970 [bacterium]